MQEEVIFCLFKFLEGWKKYFERYYYYSFSPFSIPQNGSLFLFLSLFILLSLLSYLSKIYLFKNSLLFCLKFLRINIAKIILPFHIPPIEIASMDFFFNIINLSRKVHAYFTKTHRFSTRNNVDRLRSSSIFRREAPLFHPRIIRNGANGAGLRLPSTTVSKRTQFAKV